jgi:DNA-binding MarR family transcriptional regulator
LKVLLIAFRSANQPLNALKPSIGPSEGPSESPPDGSEKSFETLLNRLDQESRLESNDHFALKIWLRMLTCANLIEADIRSGLRAEFDSTLPRFDLLAQLEREPAGLLMHELSKRLMVTSGNITALADQLASEGFIERVAVPHDRRATKIQLTQIGRIKFSEMALVHEQWVANMFSALEKAEQQQLHDLLAKLKSALRSVSKKC